METQTQTQSQNFDHHFFITDCYGAIFGNHKGYRRHRDAQAIATKNRWILWDRFDKKNAAGGFKSTLIYTIKMEHVAV